MRWKTILCTEIARCFTFLNGRPTFLTSGSAWYAIAYKKPFNTAATNFGLYKEKAAWAVKPVRLPESKPEDYKYIEGLEKLGDDITSKQRIKSKEINKKEEFLPYTREDVWKSTLHISQSLRTKQMDNVLKADPVYDHFSTNKYLKHYKQTLVDTGSVDHIVPFKHSQNYKGIQMN